VTDNGDGTKTISCTDGTSATVTNGTGTQTLTVSAEPAGANCANGGLKIVSGSTVNYVCNGANAAATSTATLPTCDLTAATNSNPIYVDFNGGLAQITGDVVDRRAVGAVQASATCDESTSNGSAHVSTGAGTEASYSPYVILTQLSRATPQLYDALQRNLTGDVKISEYMPAGGKADGPISTTLLHNAQVMSIEQITLPDPITANQYIEVQRVAFVYDGIDRTQYVINPDGSQGASISSSETRIQMADVSLPSVDTCKSSYTNGPMFMRLGNVRGDAVVRGQEDTIAVYDVCSALGTPAAAHVSTGAGSQLQSDSFVIVKKVDIASPVLHQMMAAGDQINQTRIDYVNLGGKAPITYYSTLFKNGFIVGIDEYVNSDGAQYERISMSFDEAVLTYTPIDPDGSSGASIAVDLLLNGSKS